MSEKTFIEGTHIKEKTFNTNGKEWSKLLFSFDLEKFYQHAKQFVNEKGYVNTEVKRRQTPSEYGHTHYMELDTFVPKSKGVSHPDMGGVQSYNNPNEDPFADL